ncbi:helix-turn-helix domain-containing protein [Terribacillus sp. JSM ZJ617]|uniref:helix-turn-helix domain-containing protein n=1 Tax=Terribacillus sp. JSM ZJ617 TaxID=3342119 RepID=UPI0035A834FC
MEVALIVENILGERIAALREKKDIKQYDLADRIGLTKYQLNRYEKGHSNPDPDIIVKLADFFDVTTDYLLGKSNSPKKTEEDELESFISDPELERWYKELPKTSEENLRQLKRIFEINRELDRKDDEGNN